MIVHTVTVSCNITLVHSVNRGMVSAIELGAHQLNESTHL